MCSKEIDCLVNKSGRARTLAVGAVDRKLGPGLSIAPDRTLADDGKRFCGGHCLHDGMVKGKDHYYRIDFCYHTVDFITTQLISSLVYFIITESISIQHNRFHYYTIDFITTQSMSLLHNRYYYYTIDFITTITTRSILLLHRRFHYCTLELVDFITTQSNSLLHDRFHYYTIDFFTTHSISLLHNRFLYYTIDFFTRQWSMAFFTTQSIS